MRAQHIPIQDLSTITRFEDLDSAGYVVVPAFLSDKEASLFERDFEESAPPAEASYAVRQVSAPARSAVHDKLMAVARAVKRASSVRVDHIASGVLGSIYFTTEGDIGTGWHQDAVSYYAYQNHHDYLNFYIPVVKPQKAKSNLCVVPFDRLEARSPELAAKLRGRGATRLAVKDGQTIAHDNNAGGILGTLPYDLDELAVTPQLDRGDLLLVRGDVVHRTEDKETRRIAVSIRMMNSQVKVRRADMLRGGTQKAVVMMRGRRDFQQLFDRFDATGRSELTIGELAAQPAGGAASPQPPSPTAFMTYLYWNRLRERFSLR
jgi:ectoine hydroxylase-related dioxygenase (phytanoyl-CoA dioxygenase family)